MIAETTQDQAIEYAGIRFTQAEVMKVKNGRPVESAPRSSIQRIILRSGAIASHPALEFLIGIIALALSIWPIITVIRWLTEGGSMYDLTILLVVLAPVGVWMIASSLQRGHYLQIIQESETRKIRLSGKIQPEELDRFLQEASAMGYSIERE
jgi:hypothetical protein